MLYNTNIAAIECFNDFTNMLALRQENLWRFIAIYFDGSWSLDQIDFNKTPMLIIDEGLMKGNNNSELAEKIVRKVVEAQMWYVMANKGETNKEFYYKIDTILHYALQSAKILDSGLDDF